MNARTVARYALATGNTILMAGAVKVLNDNVGKPRPAMSRVQANRAIVTATALTVIAWSIAVL